MVGLAKELLILDDGFRMPSDDWRVLAEVAVILDEAMVVVAEETKPLVEVKVILGVESAQIDPLMAQHSSGQGSAH